MPKESLIKIDNQQLALFDSAQMDPAFFAEEESGATPEFTGARLFAHNPDTYKAIVALSAEGLGAIRIGKILHVSAHTVVAVRQREPESIAIEKNRLASLSRAGARMCVEGIIEMLADPEQVKKMSIKDKGIVFGILAEKAELLSGSPTARIQSVGAPPAQEVMEYLRWLRAEYSRRMGLGEGKEEQRAPAGAKLSEHGAEPGAIEGEVALGGAEMDVVEAGEASAPGNANEAYEERRQVPIVDPGANKAIGLTPHRIDETPENIDENAMAKSTSNNLNCAEVVSRSIVGDSGN